MESLKIALASDWFFPSIGGIEYHIHDLATNLVKMGHNVHIITRFGDYSDEKLPYSVHRFRGYINLDSFYISIGTNLLRKVNELYKKEHFDITHGHSIYSPIAVGVSNLSSGIRGIPSVMTNHSFLGKSILNPTYILLLRASLRKINGFIAVSNAVRQDLENILGKSLRNRPIHVVPNGIDTNFWTPVEDKEEWKSKIGLDGIVITTTSRLTKRKRIDIIPKLARIITEKYGMTDIKFVIIGDGPERRKIEELIKAYHVQDKVLMVGKQPREKVREYLWASDIYLSPTIYEAFGIAALEALSCGVPVVANNHGGISEIVKHGLTGLVSQDDKELLENILYLLDNPELIEKMGRNARKAVKEEFSWKKIAKEIVEIYKKTIETFEENPFILYTLHQVLRGGITNVGIFNL
ncbi:glycosyltransferase family 1 protein [Thermococcus sp. M39]|uniref:glycosyltransferase family 4 protein n=1 Tax=unclassified Thermococcus TaxID=2627626 RepID=UPI00143A5F23|nr:MULTISPECIES: glycosyltransferase family 4 protein [unclassified Thermococcus]NJE07673.1 glycosyltransferase family 1 protein [Thermococcus sp. M39]NJE12229.1 glycosyltransferase family 1 protein [Thermococcus sp. LS2]